LSSAKTLRVAASTVIQESHANQTGLGTAAKFLASSVPPLIHDANHATGACLDEYTEPLVIAVRKIAKECIDLIQEGETVSLGKSNTTPSLNGLSKKIEELQDLLNKSAPGLLEINEALKRIEKAVQTFPIQGEKELKKGKESEHFDELRIFTTSLEEATKGLVSTSRKGEEIKMGQCAKNVSLAIEGIMKKVAPFHDQGSQTELGLELEKISVTSQNIVDGVNGEDTVLILRNAKQLTEATSSLGKATGVGKKKKEKSTKKNGKRSSR